MDDKKLSYYNGLNDGVNICGSIMMMLVEGAEKTKSVKEIKLMLTNTAIKVAEIMDSTSLQIKSLLNEKEN